MQHHQLVVLTSSAPPSIRWWCPSCDTACVFECRETFRVNANGKILDVWLLYACRSCDRTKKLSVLERAPLHKVPADLRRRAEDNDTALARRLARDARLLRRNSAQPAEGDRWTATPSSIGPTRPGATTVELVFPEPLIVRITTVAARLLGISNSELARRQDAGDILLGPVGKLTALRLWSYAAIDLKSPVRSS